MGKAFINFIRASAKIMGYAVTNRMKGPIQQSTISGPSTSVEGLPITALRTSSEYSRSQHLSEYAWTPLAYICRTSGVTRASYHEKRGLKIKEENGCLLDGN
jgi:hypothetical protein